MAHRYWRLATMNSSPGGGAAIAEVRLQTVFGGSTVTGSGTASASTTFSGSFLPANAFDGNTSTLWSAASADTSAWLEYDFGSGNAFDILGVSLTCRNDGFPQFSPSSFDLQYSDDNSTWTSVVGVKTCATWTGGAIQSFDFTPLGPSAGAALFTGFAPTYSGGNQATQARFTQIGAEAWVKNPPAAVFTQIGVEAWIVGNPAAAFTQIGVEVWRTTADALAAGVITFTGFAPTSDPQSSPGGGSIRFTGFAPTNVFALAPAAGAMLFTGFAPTVPVITSSAAPIVVVMS
jgi:hypothetical protein